MENIRIQLLLDEVYSVMMKESIEEKKTFVSKIQGTMSYEELKTITQYNTKVMSLLKLVDDVKSIVDNIKCKHENYLG